METFFRLAISLLDKLNLKRVILFGLLTTMALMAYYAYYYAPEIGDRYLTNIRAKELTVVKPGAQKSINSFMSKHHSTAIYLTVMKFNFLANMRAPIYHEFNNDDVKQDVFKRLNGGDGAIPLFIKDDIENNDQVISIIQGETICNTFSAGGLGRVWPDMVKIFAMSCRVPVPPAAGGVRGYVAVHMNKILSGYELESFKLDLRLLANDLHRDSD